MRPNAGSAFLIPEAVFFGAGQTKAFYALAVDRVHGAIEAAGFGATPVGIGDDPGWGAVDGSDFQGAEAAGQEERLGDKPRSAAKARHSSS